MNYLHRKSHYRILKSLLLIFIFVISLPANAEKKLQVITTFTIIADIAQNVAGDAADVQSITKAGAEIHQYQPTPRDIVKAQRADLILYNGLNLELWFEKFFQQLKDTPSVILSEGIKPISIADGDYKDKPNPHAWMSPSDVLIYVDNIEKALSLHDSKNAAIYQENAKAYKQKIMLLQQKITKDLEAIDEANRWLVTSEGAFSYFARDFNLQELYLWPINADQQGSPQQIRRVIDTINDKDIPVIFSESTVSAEPSKQVAKETGAYYGGVLYVDSLSKKNGPVPTYLDLIRVTSETVVAGLLHASKTKDH